MPRSSKVALIVIVASVVTLAVGCQAPKPTPDKFNFTASASGTTLKVSPLGFSAPTAAVGLSCTTKPGLASAATSPNTSLSGLGSTGTVSSRVTTSAGVTVASNAFEEISGVNLLDGFLTADSVHVTSGSAHNVRGFHTAASATFANLIVGGVHQKVIPPVGTVTDLPGYGTLTLNEQNRNLGLTGAAQSTNAIHIRITMTNPKNYPVGSELIIGQASSAITGPLAGLLAGKAYGASVDGGPVPERSAWLATMPCGGTNGATVSTSQAGQPLPAGSSVGRTNGTVRGVIDKNAGSAETTSSVAGISLVSGLVTADAVRADAHAGISATSKVFSDSGSTLTNLRIRGRAGTLDKAPANTIIVLPGVGTVGTLYLHRVIKTVNTSAQVEIRMLELVVTENGNGVPVGTDLRVGVALASVS
jgi:hypothetical protein